MLFPFVSLFLCILLHPASCIDRRNATEGDSVKLSVSLPGTGRADNIKWTICCQGLQIVNNTKFLLLEDVLTVSLTIINVTNEDSGTYMVTVTNNTQVIEMQSFEVQVQALPVFLEQPTPVSDLVQEVVQLVCKARATPLPVITWFRNTVQIVHDNNEDISIINLQGETVVSSVLTIHSLSLDVAGIYHCNATNNLVSEASVSSDVAVVTALYAPDVRLSPSPTLTINISDTVTINCSVFGIPLPNVTWTTTAVLYQDMSQLDSYDGVTIVQSDDNNIRTSLLTLSNISKMAEGVLTCSGQNLIQNVLNTPLNRSLQLIVQVPPMINHVSPSSIDAIEGNSINLQFNITDDDPPVNISNIVWTLSSSFGSEDITQSSSPHFQLSPDRLSLRVINVQVSVHSGNYIFTASNEAGTRSLSITVMIDSSPKIFIIPQDVMALEGDTVSFDCLVTGQPTPDQTWLFEEVPFTEFDLPRVTIGENQFGTLNIYNITLQDEGTYTCVYNSSIGDIIQSAQLTVQVSPVLVDIDVPSNGTAGGSIILTCNSTGVPVPSITWLKNDSIIPSVDGKSVISSLSMDLESGIESIVSTLQLQGLVLSDKSMYSCRADNDLATPQTQLSDQLQLDILYPPDVSIDINSLTVNQSDQSSFTCTAFGIPLPSFMWYFNDSSDPISSDNIVFNISNIIITNGSGLVVIESTLTILNTSKHQHEGNYSCRATNGIDNLIGTPESADTLLIVQVPPRVLVVSEDPVGVVNRSVNITFSINEAFPLVMIDGIQWYFNDSSLLNNLSMAVVTTGHHIFTPDLLTLTLTNIQHSDQGLYSLTATNEAGTSTAQVFLEVEAAPVITVSPSDRVQLEGQNVMFMCEAVSEPLYSVTWQFNETLITTNSSKYLINNSSGGLSIFSVTLNDSGVYTCTVDNIHGSDMASAVLTVQAIPQFIVNPIDMAVLVIGDSIQLNCSSFGVPLPNITWLMNGSTLELSRTVQVSSTIEGQFNTFSELTLSQLSFNNTGSYSCISTNELASLQFSISSSAVIIVNMPVVILESPVNSVVNETDTVMYSCVAKGLPTPIIIWSTPLQPNLNNDDTVNITELTNRQSPEASIVESTLQFTSIMDSDATSYTCSASNVPRNNGNVVTVNNTFNITVQTEPVVMFTGNETIVGVQLKESMMTFNISRDLPSVKVEDIRWFFTQQGTNIKKEITQTERFTFTSDRLTLTITQLSLNDSGVYSVDASNIVGTGTANAVLDVQKAPVIILPLTSLTQLSGTTATFICEADANPQHTIEWTKDNQQLFNSTRILITGLGTARSTLTIMDIQLNDTGSYECIAENIHGNDSTSDQLFVQVPPQYINSPSSVNVTAGTSTVIECNVEGFPKPSVQLLKDNQTLDTSVTSNGSLGNGLLFEIVSLTLNELTFTDSGSYSCRASNYLASLETRNSPSALYTIQYAPNVSVSPLAVIVNESDTITLLCEVSAIPIPTIVWLNSSSSDNPVTDQEETITVTEIQLPTNTSSIPITVSTLSIANIVKAHEANYTCVTSNGIDNLLGTPENGTIPVTVQVRPSAIADNEHLLGVVNRSITLRFSIDRASPEVDPNNIEWSFTSSENNVSVDIIGNSLNDKRLLLSMDLLTLTINELQHSDEGVYTITARNPAGTTSASIMLSIEASPVFIIKPTDSSVLSGESVVFSCNASAEPLYSIRWERDGVPIAQYLSTVDDSDNVLAFARLNTNNTGVPVTINSSKYLLEDEGPYYGQLTVLDAQLDDARTYSCVINNIHGSITASANLLVQVTPVFISEFKPIVNLSVAENVTFTCNAAGQPEPNVTWYRNGILLTNMDPGVTILETPGIRQFNANLTLTNVTRAVEGEYWCNATNFRFVRYEVTSPRWEVNIHYPPDIIKSPVTLQRQAAQYAVFTCVITGFPIPDIQWTRTGIKPINTNLTGKFQIKDNTLDTTNTIGPYTIESQLTVFNLSFDDQQIYTCNGISQVDVNNFINAIYNASASLFVNVPPHVIPSIDSPSIAIWDRMYTIPFNIINAQPDVDPQNITWSFYPSDNSGKQILTGGNDRLMFSSNRRSLIISNVRLDDDGRYEVTGSNVAGTSTATVTINVLVKPSINGLVTSYDGSVANISSTIVFNCTGIGLPLPIMSWRYNGTVITTTGRFSITTNVKGEGIPHITSVLTLNNVKEGDDYSQWSCIVENRVGRDEQSTILRVHTAIFNDHCLNNPCLNNGTCFTMPDLSVPFVCLCTNGFAGLTCGKAVNPLTLVPPFILVPPKPILEELNSIVNLTCIANGNPQPNIEWYKDGDIINDAKSFQYTFELNVNSRGWYTCRAVSNLEGGQILVESTDPVLVTINNIAQYLVTMSVPIDSLHKIYEDITDEQLLEVYVTQGISSGIAGTMISNNSVLLSVSLHQTLSQSSNDTIVFTTVMTVVTDGLYQHEPLRDVILAYKANPSFELIQIERFDGCGSEVTSFSSSIYWPETNLGFSTTLDCPCGDLSLGAGHPTATRTCEGNFTTGAVWGQSHDVSCDFNSNAESLCEVSSVSDINTILLELSNLSSEVNSDIEVVISVALLEDRFNDMLDDVNITSKFLSIINEIMSISESILQQAQLTGNVSSRILMIIDRFGKAIFLSNSAMHSIQQSLFSLAVVDSMDGQFYYNTSTAPYPLHVNVTTSLHNNISSLMASNSSKYVVTLFPDDRLFLPADPNTTQLVSSVIGITAIDTTDQSVNMTFNINQSLVSDFSELVCVFWDFTLAGGRGDWSTNGCYQLVVASDTTRVTCSCNHFTHFSVIRRVDDDATMMDVKDKHATFLTVVEIIAVVLMIVSVLFLIVTIIVYLKTWTFSDKPSTSLFLNTCISMVILYLVYIIAIYTSFVRESAACTVLAAILHYSFLVSVISIMLECWFFTLRKSRASIEKYSPVAVLIAWLVPVLIVIFCVAPANQLYSSNNVCLPRGAPFYIGVVAPFIIAMCLSLCTVILSCFLSYKLNTVMDKLHWAQLIIVLIIFSIGWIFGLAEADASSALLAGVLELVYSITFGLLGVYIFGLYCLAPPDIREVLWQKKGVKSTDSNGNNTSRKWSSRVKGTLSLQKLSSLNRNDDIEEANTASPNIVTNDGYLSQLNSPTKSPNENKNPSEDETVDL